MSNFQEEYFAWNTDLGNSEGQLLSDDEDAEDVKIWLEEVKQLRACVDTQLEVVENTENISGQSDILSLISNGLTTVAPTYNNVLVFNRIIICILKQIESQVFSQLKKNKQMQETVVAELASLRNGKLGRPHIFPCSFQKCGMPFFKLQNGWAQPKNAYTKEHESLGFATPYDHFKPVFFWTPKDNKKISNSVVTSVKQTLLEKLENRVRQIVRTGGDPLLLKETSRELKLLHSSGPRELDERTVDWLRVAASLGPDYSAEDCQAQWKYVINPKINRTKWTAGERKKLSEVAKANYFQSWDRIARELGTERSGLQCCISFQRHTPLIDKKWTPEEEKKFEDLVSRFLITSARPFHKVCYFYEGVSRQYIRRKYQNMLIKKNLNMLPVSERFKRKLSGACNYLPNKTWKELKGKHEQLMSEMRHFSCEEDRLLLEGVSNHGDDWTVISELLPGRQIVEIKTRYRKLTEFSKSVLKAVSSCKSPMNLLPSVENEPNGRDVWATLQIMWENPGKSATRTRYGLSLGSNMSIPTQQLLRVMEFGHKNLFGPRYVEPRTDAQKQDMTINVAIACHALSSHFAPNAIIERLHRQSSLLGYLVKPERDVLALKDVEVHGLIPSIGRSLVPPNLLTLLGVRVLSSARGLLTGQAGLTIPLATTTFDPSIPPEDRLRPCRAAELLKTRMLSLFFLSLCMSKIARSPGKYNADAMVERIRSKSRPKSQPPTKYKKKMLGKELAAARWGKTKSASGDGEKSTRALPGSRKRDLAPKERNLEGAPKAKMIRVTSLLTNDRKGRCSRNIQVELLDSRKCAVSPGIVPKYTAEQHECVSNPVTEQFT